jgi:hypothetical protein
MVFPGCSRVLIDAGIFSRSAIHLACGASVTVVVEGVAGLCVDFSILS